LTELAGRRSRRQPLRSRGAARTDRLRQAERVAGEIDDVAVLRDDVARTVPEGRDASTGEFIPVKEAERRPRTTTVETIKTPPPKKK
jgi:hypothetical protein